MLARILIVEDESLVAMDMADTLRQLGYDVMSAAYSYDEAVELLQQGPDLVLMDINLGSGRSGIELAQLIRDKYQIPFVFLTSHSDKATVAEAAATQPSGYLVKPYSGEDLFASIEVALANFAKRKGPEQNSMVINESLFVKTDTHFVKVTISDIMWVESDHNYLYIVTDRAKHIVRSSFKDFMTNLPQTLFIQVHKSFVVNIKKIDSFSGLEVLVGKNSIPLSRNYKDDLFERMTRIQ